MRLAVLVFAFCVVLCVVGHVAVIASVLRSRSTVADANVPRPRLGLEVLWTLIPAVLLLIVLTATWPYVRERSPQRSVLFEAAR